MKYCPTPKDGDVGLHFTLSTEWRQCISTYVLNSDGQVDSSSGKEGVDYFKKGWEHVWLKGNNQVLNSTN
jgi:hypothetical protein